MDFRPAPLILAIGLTLIFAVRAPARAVEGPVDLLQAGSPAKATAPAFSLGGMIAATAQGRFDAFEPFFSLRALPKLDFSLPAGPGWTFDGEASANIYGALDFPRHSQALTAGDIRPYRGWLRLSGARFEARLGLQQLSFGSATLFRPLMWFDSLDPRDPLQLTNGVYGLLLRFYAKGNANAWIWSLYGNTERRGFDAVPPDKKSPEFGGRIELPLFKGEIAATYHHRKVDIGILVPIMSPVALPFSQAARHAADLSGASPLPIFPVPEDRFGVDGKWDIGIGVWFEGALVHQHSSYPAAFYQRAYTLGADYTFSVGRGLTVLAEHFRIASSARAFSSGNGVSFTALLMRYPLGLLDELSGIFYYDWKNRGVYRFVGWTRRTDTITFSAIAFWNPAGLVVFQGRPGSGSFAGIGLELILAYSF